MKKITILIIFCGLAIHLRYASYGQSLPKKQTQSIWLPATFKIDGKADEWAEKFQCYNKNVHLYCTISNDKDQLYLIVKATDPIIIKKIIAGGIGFTVCKSGDRGEIHPFVLSFPNVQFSYQLVLFRDINDYHDSDKKDSLIKNFNSYLTKAIKQIKIEGNKISHNTIPLTNEIGIKAAVHVDEHLQLVCEMLVPLKLIDIESFNNPIAYNIMLKGGSATYKSKKVGDVEITDIPMGLASNDTFQEINFPTDFWGVCAPAKQN